MEILPHNQKNYLNKNHLEEEMKPIMEQYCFQRHMSDLPCILNRFLYLKYS